MSKKNIFFGFLILLTLLGFIKKDYFFEELPRQLFEEMSFKQTAPLVIVSNTPPTDLSEYSLNLNNLTVSANIFEGLVAFDRNLRILPALAVSWGNLNELTWEFKLRKEVFFHDQSPFNAGSVLFSYKTAKNIGDAQIKTLLNSIQEIKIIDPYTIQIITKEPDPLILSKLTKFFISRPGQMGTGPYRLESWKKEEKLILSANKDYWGRRPSYPRVEYVIMKDRKQREEAFLNGNIDILISVTPEQALKLSKDLIKTSYSLEVSFLMFRMNDPLLEDRAAREAIRTLFDPQKIEEIGNHFVRQVSQFVAPGVYGYNAAIPLYIYNEENRVKNFFGEQKKKIRLDFLTTYRTLAQYLQKQLSEMGFLVESRPVDPNELLASIKSNQSPLFIIGWQAENGDAGDFLDAFIHNQGEFNNGRYQNLVVDKLIEKSRKEINPQERLKILQKIMELVDKDLIGIPLFESSRLYAVKKEIDWEPRLDGLVLAKDVK